VLPTQAGFTSTTPAGDPSGVQLATQLPSTNAFLTGAGAVASGAGGSAGGGAGAGAGSRAASADLPAAQQASAGGAPSWDPARRAALSRENELAYLKDANRALKDKVTELEDVVELVEVEAEAQRRNASVEASRAVEALKLQIAFKVREAEDSEVQRLAASRELASAVERLRALESELAALRTAASMVLRPIEDTAMEESAAPVSAVGTHKSAAEPVRTTESVASTTLTSKGPDQSVMPAPLPATALAGDAVRAGAADFAAARIPRHSQRAGAVSAPSNLGALLSTAAGDDGAQSRAAASAAIDRTTLRASIADAQSNFSRNLLVDGLLCATAFAGDLARLSRGAGVASDVAVSDEGESAADGTIVGAFGLGAGNTDGVAGWTRGGAFFGGEGRGGDGGGGMSGDDPFALTATTQTPRLSLSAVTELSADDRGSLLPSPHARATALDAAVSGSLAARCAAAFRDASLSDSLAAVAETLRAAPLASRISLSALRVSKALLDVADADANSAFGDDDGECIIVNMEGFTAAAAVEDSNAPVRLALSVAAASAISTIVPSLVMQALAAASATAAQSTSASVARVHAKAWLSLAALVFRGPAVLVCAQSAAPALVEVLRVAARTLRHAFFDSGALIANAVLEAGTAGEASAPRARAPSSALDAAVTAAKLGTAAARALAAATGVVSEGTGAAASAIAALGALSVAIEMSSHTIACATGDGSLDNPALHAALLACAELQAAALSAALAIVDAKGFGHAGPWALLSLIEVPPPPRPLLPEPQRSAPPPQPDVAQKGLTPLATGAATGAARFGLSANETGGSPSSASGGQSPSASPQSSYPALPAPALILFSQSRDADAAALLHRVALAVAARVAESTRLYEAIALARDDAECAAQLRDAADDEGDTESDDDVCTASADARSLLHRFDALARVADACVCAGASLLSIAHRHVNGRAMLIVSETERVAISVPNLHGALRLASALVKEYCRTRGSTDATDDAVAIIAGRAGSRAQQEALSDAALVRGLAAVPAHLLDFDARFL
jgi:hypothetical protein